MNYDWIAPITINGGNPIIHVIGGNNTIKSDNSAGIHVYDQGTVTITGRSREDKLTVTGGNGGCGIGGLTSIGSDDGGYCGNIRISNVTVYAYGSINNSTSVASTAVPNITISGSEIHAHRGGSTADYIGWGNNKAGDTAGNGAITLGGGTCKSSTVHCYTGDTLDKTVTYDASGNGTEK